VRAVEDGRDVVAGGGGGAGGGESFKSTSGIRIFNVGTPVWILN
jgi:hypothetical protein